MINLEFSRSLFRSAGLSDKSAARTSRHGAYPNGTPLCHQFCRNDVAMFSLDQRERLIARQRATHQAWMSIDCRLSRFCCSSSPPHSCSAVACWLASALVQTGGTESSPVTEDSRGSR